MNIWDREEIMLRIKQLYRMNKDVSYTGMLDEYSELLGAAQYYFLNWGKAVTACGIDYTKVRRHETWSRKRVTKELMGLKKKGEDFTYTGFERRHRKLAPMALYYFGKWDNALSSVGVKLKRPDGWSKERIVKEIRTLKEKGVDLSWRAMRKQGYGPLHTMSHFYFGSWREAIKKAGLDYNKIKKREDWTKERVIATIKELHRQGKDLSYMKLRKQGYGKLTSMGTYYFPNWGKAIKAAGLNYSKIRERETWSKKKIINMIKDLHRRGVELSYKSLIRAGYIKLVGMAQHYFENWGNAIEASGLDYSKIRKRNQFTLRKCYNGGT